MPKVWGDTIQAHRREVHQAILDAAATLAAERGVTALSMSHVADRAGIGRATLYKYFPSIDAILMAWHEQRVRAHLDELRGLAAAIDGPKDRVAAVLGRFALIQHERHDSHVVAGLHAAQHVRAAEHELEQFLTRLVGDAVASGEARGDVPPGELAQYCLHAVGTAARLPTKVAVRRLVDVVMRGLDTP